MPDIRLNGCHSSIVGPGPRGKTTTVMMQDGTGPVMIGGAVFQLPIYVPITTEWKPMPCGALKQAGRGSDPACAGCENRTF